jgi:hypothetical protein
LEVWEGPGGGGGGRGRRLGARGKAAVRGIA